MQRVQAVHIDPRNRELVDQAHDWLSQHTARRTERRHELHASRPRCMRPYALAPDNTEASARR